ncbi:aci13, partial [Cymbomonas tetramitiformis]
MDVTANQQEGVGVSSTTAQPNVLTDDDIISEKLIEEKEKQLHEQIHTKYAALKVMEQELKGLKFQVSQTVAPQRSALEHLRKKIELASAE